MLLTMTNPLHTGYNLWDPRHYWLKIKISVAVKLVEGKTLTFVLETCSAVGVATGIVTVAASESNSAVVVVIVVVSEIIGKVEVKMVGMSVAVSVTTRFSVVDVSS